MRHLLLTLALIAPASPSWRARPRPGLRPGGLTSESWTPRIDAPGFSARKRMPWDFRTSTTRSEPWYAAPSRVGSSGPAPATVPAARRDRAP